MTEFESDAVRLLSIIAIRLLFIMGFTGMTAVFAVYILLVVARTR